MLPVSMLHFLVTLAYVILAMTFLKMVAIKRHKTPSGQALGVMTF